MLRRYNSFRTCVRNFTRSCTVLSDRKRTLLAVECTHVKMTAIQKPQVDDRQYSYLTLPNDLQAVIISDPTADKCAAALDVNVGHFSDPAEIAGLAHFCEHMLFLGTLKFPEEGSYQAFVKHSGGMF
jgi:insulysin